MHVGVGDTVQIAAEVNDNVMATSQFGVFPKGPQLRDDSGPVKHRGQINGAGTQLS